jgi:hypothetical protein
MATPHVAGAAALYKATHPSATPGQVKAALLCTREDIALVNDPDGIDEGVLNIGGAFDPNPPPDPGPDPGPDPPPPGDDVTAPIVQWQAPVGNNGEFVTGGGTVALEASASDDVGVDRVEFWLYSRASESWVSLGSDLTAPYQSTIETSELDPGSNFILAEASDRSGNTEAKMISIHKSSSPTVAPGEDTSANNNTNAKKPRNVKKDKNKKKGKTSNGKKGKRGRR